MSAPNGWGGRGGKRRRRRPNAYTPKSSGESAAEERYLQQAIQNSKLDKNRPPDGKVEVPWGPVFFPTKEDFQGNPLEYFEKVCRPIAEKYGICKIVPPEGWNPAPFCIDTESKKRFQTKLQVIHRLQEGISYGDGVEYTVGGYLDVAGRRTEEWKAKYYPDHDLLSRHAEALEKFNNKAASSDCSDEENKSGSGGGANSNHNAKRFLPENLERDYWDIVETHNHKVTVEYGNDVDSALFGSAFPLSERGRAVNGTCDPEKVKAPEPEFGTEEYYRETFWNLNNMPTAPGSVLRNVKVGINGINVPWMYYGSLFTTFAYHNEDNYLYSVNYHHRGAPKQWYGVPGHKDAADGLEKVFKSYLSMKMRDIPDLLHHITTMFSPRLLQNAEVPVCKLLQYEGEFVLTFPRAFHGGFSYGPNAGEAVNFGSHDWIKFGADANERYRSFARPAVFSHDRLTMTLANHLEDQTSYCASKLLLNELERVAAEELDMRKKLAANGVRDVSNVINLPKNRLDKLDEKSAAYDDKRLCHACKHVCFFSAVACECSQSKVSCLRHSHYMCRCPPEKKYFMIWTREAELKGALQKLRDHTQSLKEKEGIKDDKQETAAESAKEVVLGELPPFGPGAEKDLARHKFDEIPTGNILAETYERCFSVRSTQKELEAKITADSEGKRKRGEADGKVVSDDDDVEVVEVKQA